MYYRMSFSPVNLKSHKRLQQGREGCRGRGDNIRIIEEKLQPKDNFYKNTNTAHTHLINVCITKLSS